jgi:hypothetical protein
VIRQLKVALCIPVHGMTAAKFTYSLARLVAHSTRSGLTVETFMVSSAMLPHSRNLLAAKAIKWGAKYILWLDADHTFPPNGLARLIDHGKAVVGCNYARRLAPGGPTASIPTRQEDVEARRVSPVDHLGLGFCLVDTAAIEQIEGPLFKFEDGPDGEPIFEDVYFCRRLREHGIEIFVDHALSWEIGHIGEEVKTLADLPEG